MAIALVADPHNPESAFLQQYKESTNFKLFVNSFLIPAMTILEDQYQLFISERSLQNAEGVQLEKWMEILGTTIVYVSEDELRRLLWIRASELFSIGNIYDVRDFFKNYFAAYEVQIIEIGNGLIDVDVYGGLIPPVGTVEAFKVFPVGLCEIRDIRFLDTVLTFSFATDTRLRSLGYGEVTRYTNSYYPYVWPSTMAVADRIRIQYVIGATLNVDIIFTVAPADSADLQTILSQEVFDLYDANNTQWSFKGTGSAVPGGVVTTAANGILTDVKVRICYNSTAILKPSVNGIAVRYEDMNAGGVGFLAFAGFTSSDQTLYNMRNPNGLSLGFIEEEVSNIGGRLALTY